MKLTERDICTKFITPSIQQAGYVYGAFKQSAAGGVVQNLNADKARELKIPIPPLPEQHRIVVKVDSLMVLCDQLKTCIQQAIADALVAQAVA